MGIFDDYNSSGKKNMSATRTDFIGQVGEEGIRNIVKEVLLGGNIRDFTEFTTQKRLLESYAALLDLYMGHIGEHTDSVEGYADYVLNDYLEGKGRDRRTLDLWLLGLTRKGLDNITRDNLLDYKYSFATSVEDISAGLLKEYGTLSGIIEVGNRRLSLDWTVLSLLLTAIGAQTLTIRGSAKSMNGKMFEKLILGSLLTIMGFTYIQNPPDLILDEQKLFWLSNMDENERETDATVVYNGQAISIDIGFIGKGNPEITLDKVTRFNRYKEIGGVQHNMATIIIVDTVSENSDLFHKAERVDGRVLQMKHRDWTISFAKILCGILHISHELTKIEENQLDAYFNSHLSRIDMQGFVN